MNCGIYLITNITNEKIYVGSSKNLTKRRYVHFYLLKSGKHKNPHLQNAYNFYGRQAFRFETLEYCEPKYLLEREDWWIELLDSQNPSKGYNLLSADRKIISEETRRKIGNARRGVPRTEETKAKCSAALLGKPLSEARKANISIAQKGKPWTEAQRQAHSGKTLSEETKRKISTALSGRPNIKLRGKPWSEARRAAQKARRER